ncbi:MAG: PBP1A family penicillin-binding protein [Rhodospirillales bacterium]|nr:PBP1A family penicillin-binding protein [Alphaproteobacteria bacterium]USO03568.1 MAG: PBP1A family penicillin-binding protein [Rhodospirillales bacterium]
MAKKTKKKKNNGKRSLLGRLMLKLLKWGIVLGLWACLFLGGLMVFYAQELTDITEDMVFERRPTIIIKANDGTVLDRYGDIKGKSVTVEDIPQHVVYAVLATEDRRFYEHSGIDPIGIARAFAVNIIKGGFVQGGSTITQQLAKNLFLSRERKLKRKIQEAMLAIWLEHKLTKDEILSAYLNRVYLGSGAYGIEAAASVYFGKTVQELTLREAATLAGLLKAPSRYSPRANPVLSAQRTKVVLNAMVEAGFIEQAEVDKLNNLPPSPHKKPSSGETIRYFTDYIVAQIEDLIGPVTQDLVIETTLDKDIQKEAEESITKALLLEGAAKDIGQGAAIVMTLDGAIVGMVGGRDYGMSEFNRATNALRPPGSSFKPFVYLTALEQGWKIDDTIVDEEITTGRYRPKNYGGQYYGEVTMIEALTYSLNTVAISLMREVKPPAVIGMARRLGITADLEPDLSLALGSSGVPVIQMATAYASLGRGGMAVEPFSIIRIKDSEDKVYYERPAHHQIRRVADRQNVYDLTTMMQSVMENGTGRGAQGPYIAAGKTGTSQDFRDAWFIGFTDRYAAAVWFGNDDNSPMKRVTGGATPARVWREIMTKATQKRARSYGSYTDVSSDFSFHDLMGRLLGEGEGGSGLSKRNTPEGEDYTPLGRHKWDFND